ncbi:UNVERIFIED_CONTAM: Sugar transport protein 8 [Sesamum radiatum]|uniref:Sugar transport protein 8 n=1 Tax=Sesamum radiatum TaxID=300843 RepID=A0AAW2W0X5_SESRA
MDDFLLEFFPTVYEKKHRAKENNYCKYDNQLLQLFTSSLYLAAVVCSWAAAFCCKKFGRKRTMQMAAAFFLVGVVLNAASVNIYMLIAGRICLGAGIGFGNQMLITIGILIANVVNYFTSKIHPYGWRISIGGAGFPAIFLGLGSLLIIETPTSLIECGKTEEGLKALKQPGVWKMSRKSIPAVHWDQRHHVLCSGALPDHGPRCRCVFVVSSRHRLHQLCLHIGCSLWGFRRSNSHTTSEDNKRDTHAIRLLDSVSYLCIRHGVCVVMGPLGWLIPSEIFPLETRPAGFFFAVSSNMICTFIIAQAFLTMLCQMRSGIFFFFAAWIVVMGSFAVFLLPETKGVLIDEMNEQVWKKHWFWRRFFKPEDEGQAKC